MSPVPTSQSIQNPTHVTILYNQDFDVSTSSTDIPNEPEDPFSSSDTLQGETARASVLTVAQHISDVLTNICGLNTSLVPVQTLDDVKQCLKQQANSSSLIFNLCESLNKDARFEARVASLLHASNIPYTGNHPRTLSLCLNKFRTTERLRKHGVTVPHSDLIRKLKQLPVYESFPRIVKPNREDGSTGIESASVVYSQHELEQQVKKILKECNQAALVQEFIDGREISVSLLGHKQVKILGIGEINFSKLHAHLPKIVTYASKWVPGSPEYEGTVSEAAQLTKTEQEQIEHTAKAVVKAMFLTGYSRIDIRLDNTGTPYVIDVNPNCDLDPEAGLAKTAARNGMSYRQLIGEIIEAGIAARVPSKRMGHFHNFLDLLLSLTEPNQLPNTNTSPIPAL